MFDGDRAIAEGGGEDDGDQKTQDDGQDIVAGSSAPRTCAHRPPLIGTAAEVNHVSGRDRRGIRGITYAVIAFARAAQGVGRDALRDGGFTSFRRADAARGD